MYAISSIFALNFHNLYLMCPFLPVCWVYGVKGCWCNPLIFEPLHYTVSRRWLWKKTNVRSRWMKLYESLQNWTRTKNCFRYCFTIYFANGRQVESGRDEMKRENLRKATGIRTCTLCDIYMSDITQLLIAISEYIIHLSSNLYCI